MTEVYNPKTFVPHAASHSQTFVHWKRFSTAASRRSPGSVSVPMWLTTLLSQLPVLGLVGHYPANYLIGHEPLSKRQLINRGHRFPLRISAQGLIWYYSRFREAIPFFEACYPCIIHPFAAIPKKKDRSTCMPNPRRQRSL